MSHKRIRSSAQLHFPSGNLIWTDNIRRNLAKRIAERGNDWLALAEELPREGSNPFEYVKQRKLARYEQSAANWLEGRGMIERHESNRNLVRWSVLHERPTFGLDRESHDIYGKHVMHLSLKQKYLLSEVMMENGLRRTHDVLVLGDVKIQRMLRALERRRILEIQRGKGVWRLTIGAEYRAKPKTT